MNDWHVMVTDDMENYHDYGAVLSYKTFKWANASAFAGHCEYRNGKFYWYVAVHHGSIKQDEGFAIGVAVADHPSGPWVDVIGHALVTDLTENDVKLNILLQLCIWLSFYHQLFHGSLPEWSLDSEGCH